MPIFYQPQQRLFQNSQEHRYFRFYCDQMASDLSGYFDLGLWDRIVLQACDQVPSIRHAVIALAALKSISEATQFPFRSVEEEEEIQKNHRFAIQQYSKAIQYMRGASIEGKQDLRTTLIACLVTFYFETFHGNHASAVKQVIIGLDLLEDELSSNVDGVAPSIDEERKDDQIPMILCHAPQRFSLESCIF
jgi:hypothetical protein